MELVNVKLYHVDVRLTAADCMLLAEACEAMTLHVTKKAREADVSHVETMGAAFKGAGLAALAQWSMCGGCQKELKGAIAEVTPPDAGEIKRTA